MVGLGRLGGFMAKKKRVPLGEGVVGNTGSSKKLGGVTWGFTGKLGTKYTAAWSDDKVRLEVNGGFIGDVPLREYASEAEAEQVVRYYFNNFNKREMGGVRPKI